MIQAAASTVVLLRNYYPDLEALSEALAERELKENLAGIAIETAGVYPLGEINTETGDLF